jgi:two-component system OmpR family sensor kinase
MTGRPLAAARQVAARTPLQVKLIVAVLALVAVALALISLASVTALRSYLVGRLDNQLQLVAQRPDRPPGELDGRAGLRPGPPSPFLVQERDPSGQVVEENSANLLDQDQQLPRVPADPAWLQAHAGTPTTVPAFAGGGRWRVLVRPISDGGSRVIAASLTGIDNAAGWLIRFDLVVSLLVVAALAGIGAMLVRASLRPLVEIEQTARAIAAGDLTRRVPDRDPRTEVGRLGRALNTMLTQIEVAFRAKAASEERMRQFVTDASHELRTPLTTIRGFAELYRQGTGRLDPGELERLVRQIEDQAARMGLLVEDLLLLARLDQQRPLERVPVDLLALTADAVHDARVLAPDRRIELAARGDGGWGPPVVLGDEARLRQVLANLMSNALAHTPAGTPVTLLAQTQRLDGVLRAVVEVVDHGPGLDPNDTERVFERFYRADPARSRSSGGTGLGLAIVAALVAAHGGTVEAESTPGQGATFRVMLPLAPDTPSQDELTAALG